MSKQNLSTSYWEVFDASLVRDVEASKKGPVNCVALNNTGEHFLSVGHDQIVKVSNEFSTCQLHSNLKLFHFSYGIIRQVQ